MLTNKNGEADYNVWYHCLSSLSSNIVILGSDTDIIMGIWDGFYGTKQYT